MKNNVSQFTRVLSPRGSCDKGKSGKLLQTPMCRWGGQPPPGHPRLSKYQNEKSHASPPLARAPTRPNKKRYCPVDRRICHDAFRAVMEFDFFLSQHLLLISEISPSFFSSFLGRPYEGQKSTIISLACFWHQPFFLQLITNFKTNKIMPLTYPFETVVTCYNVDSRCIYQGSFCHTTFAFKSHYNWIFLQNNH